VALPPQLRKHDPVQVILQVEVPSQMTPALDPTVAVQFEFPWHSIEHLSRQVPVQVVWSSHVR